jgi:hypothetical protein
MKLTLEIAPPPQTVTVKVTPDDIIAALLQDTEEYTAREQLVRAANTLSQIFKALPDTAIAALTPEGRALIRTFLLQQAKRFE